MPGIQPFSIILRARCHSPFSTGGDVMWRDFSVNTSGALPGEQFCSLGLFLTCCSAERWLRKGGSAGDTRGVSGFQHAWPSVRILLYTGLFLGSGTLSSHFKENTSVNIKTTGSLRLTCFVMPSSLGEQAGRGEGSSVCNSLAFRLVASFTFAVGGWAG